ncbi:MAG: HD domain-containing protein [Clostridia bacterium]|nr:HD domain-containing protein [Clostridia bacterium]
MDYLHDISIREMKTGMAVEGFFILKEASPRTTNAGKPYLAGKLGDRDGMIDFVNWDYAGTVDAGDAGHVVKVRGEVTDYRGSPQLAVTRIRLAKNADGWKLEDLVPTAPIDREAAMAQIRRMAESIEDEEYRKIALAMLEERGEAFSLIPAAKSVHHGFVSGLLMHTFNMLKAAEFFASVYPETVDRSLLLAGTLLHDFAKTEEFAFSELGLVTEYTPRGKLLGHLVMGADNVRRKAGELGLSEEKTMLLCHMVLSHHGEPEFGAAVLPRCAEAELLYHIDLIDSRMEIYRESLEGVAPGTFSGKIFALDKDIYKRG